jgi:hypothetical protein
MFDNFRAIVKLLSYLKFQLKNIVKHNYIEKINQEGSNDCSGFRFEI